MTCVLLVLQFDFTHTYTHTYSTHWNQQTYIHVLIYINTTRAHIIAINKKLSDIKNLIHSAGVHCFCFSKIINLQKSYIYWLDSKVLPVREQKNIAKNITLSFSKLKNIFRFYCTIDEFSNCVNLGARMCTWKRFFCTKILS